MFCLSWLPRCFFLHRRTAGFVWAKNNGKVFSSIIKQMEQLTTNERDLSKRVHIGSVDELSTIAGS
jgi:hypothetical protein